MKFKEALSFIAKNLKDKVVFYKNIYKDPATPLLPKLLLALAVGYFLMPFDLIPDFIPVIGHLDDAVIVPFLIYVSLKMVPREIREKHKDLL